MTVISLKVSGGKRRGTKSRWFSFGTALQSITAMLQRCHCLTLLQLANKVFSHRLFLSQGCLHIENIA